MKKDSVYWTTLSGRRVFIKNMSTTHIINSIKMIENNPWSQKNSIKKLNALKTELYKRIDPNKILKDLL